MIGEQKEGLTLAFSLPNVRISSSFTPKEWKREREGRAKGTRRRMPKGEQENSICERDQYVCTDNGDQAVRWST